METVIRPVVMLVRMVMAGQLQDDNDSVTLSQVWLRYRYGQDWLGALGSMVRKSCFRFACGLQSLKLQRIHRL